MASISPEKTQPAWVVAEALEIGFTTTFQWVYDDSGSGASADGSFFQPDVSTMTDFWPLGSVVFTNGYGYNPTGDQAVVVVKDLSGDALKPPTGFEQVWNDHGSGGTHDGSIWRPVAPDGYVAMGLVVSGGYDQPSLDSVRCVHESLVHRGTPGDALWSDAGSGAHLDFGSWEVVAPDPAAGTLSLAPGTFCGAGSYDQNSVRAEPTTLYAFAVALPEQPEPSPPAYPKLTSIVNPGPFGAGSATVTTTLPWFAVTDPDYPPLQRMVKSPAYRLERTDRWALGDTFYYNHTAEPLTRSVTVTEGVNGSSATTFASETGIELGVEYGFTALVKGTVKLSQKFTYTTSDSSGWSKESSKTDTYTVRPWSAHAYYVLNSTYRLFREDGTEVNTAVAGYNPPGTVYETEYSSKHEHEHEHEQSTRASTRSEERLLLATLTQSREAGWVRGASAVPRSAPRRPRRGSPG